MPRVNILKQLKVGDRWKLVSIPRDAHGRCEWKALPEGRYFIEWWERGKRRRQAAGATTADALEAARRRKHILEGRALGVEAYAAAEEEARRTPDSRAALICLRRSGPCRKSTRTGNWKVSSRSARRKNAPCFSPSC